MPQARLSQHQRLKLFIAAVIITSFLAAFTRFLPEIKLRFDNFFQLHGDYDLLRNQYTINLNEGDRKGRSVAPITVSGAWEASHVIPLNASVNIHPPHWTLPKIAARYSLFPRPADNGSPYILDLDGSFKDLPKGGTWVKFGSGTTLYVKAGYAFAHYPSAQHPHWIWAALTVMATAIIYTLTGFLLCALLRISVRTTGVLRFFLASFLTGFLMLNAITTLAMMAGIPLKRLELLCLWGVVLLQLFLAARRNLATSIKELNEAWSDLVSQKVDRLDILGSAGAVILGGVLALSIGFSAIMDWDGMLHWAYQAKLFFYHQGFAFAYPDLNYYPPLWPVAMASLLTLTGSFYDAPLSWLNALNFTLFCAQFFASLRVIGCPIKQAVVPFLLFMTFFFHTNTFFYWTYAETIFLVFLLGLITNVYLWIKDNKDAPSFNLALLYACALSLIKLEGVVFAALITLSALVVNRDLKRCALLVLLPAALISIWIGWINMKGLLIPISHLEHAAGWATLNYFLALLVTKALEISWTHLLFILLIASALLFKPQKWDRPVQFLGYTFLGLALFSVIAVLGVYPERMETQLERVTPRLFVHAAAVLILWWASVVGSQEWRKK